MNEINSKSFLSNTIWKFLERFLAQGVSFAVSIILARLLSPDDFSVVSIVTIFFVFANVLISGGLNTALIQKKNADLVDYSTVLHISLILSIIVYFALFFTAPLIADLFNKNELILIIRIMSLSLPITAIKSIWCAYISSHLMFKKFFYATLGGTIISAIIGILMAYKGFGAWALVAQNMSNLIIDTIILIITTRIKILPSISFSRFTSLFKYGWKILVSSLLGALYTEITPLVIGIKYTNSDLAFYTKGKAFPSQITTTIINTLSAVLFPYLTKFQESKDKILELTRKFIKCSSFIVFPMLMGLFSISDNFVFVFLTEKWMPASFYIKLFSICLMFDVVAIGNCETIKAIGKSGVYLIMEIIKKSIYFTTILIFVIFSNSPEIMALSSIVCVVTQIIVNSIPNKKIIDYKFRQQIFDILPSLIASSLMAFAVLVVSSFNTLYGIDILVKQIIVGIATYLLISVLINKKTILLAATLIFKNKNK